MKTLSLLLSLFAYTQLSGAGDLIKYGPLSVALYSSLLKCEHDRNLNLNVSGINVYFYDFPNNNAKSFPIGNATHGILNIQGLDKTKKFFIFVAGYRSSINKSTEEQVRKAFKNVPNSYLIILDHSPYTNDKKGHQKGYTRSVKYVHYIGKVLAQMLAGLKDEGISPKKMHCIGHSLGSQILGNTGEIFLKKTGEKIWRITAIDPAGPCFSNSLIEKQVRSGVAEYVEVYHCNAGRLGTTSVLADIDIFMNDGSTQPNCQTSMISSAECSHSACIDMYIASISQRRHSFLAFKCDKYDHFKKGLCSSNDRTLAGFWNPGNATGVFYFSSAAYKSKMN